MPDIEFIHFAPVHLEQLCLQPAQAHLQDFYTQADAALLSGPYGWTAILDDTPVACGGIIKQWPGRGLAVAAVGHVPASEWMAATNHVRRVLMDALANEYHRLEIAVSVDFPAGHRWAKALGFEVEGVARAYDPWRNDCILYGRIS